MRCSRTALRLGTVLVGLLFSAGVHAAPIVTPTVTPTATGFHYDYSITNDLADDIVLVDIDVLLADATLTDLFAPTGFLALYDGGIGIVSFLADFGSFDVFAPGTTVSGFGFDSAHAPAVSTFHALTLFGDTVSGPTLAPVGPADSVSPVSSPSAVVLLLLGLLGLSFASRKRG